MASHDVREPTGSLAVIKHPIPQLRRGVCFVMFAFELGLSINLDQAAAALKQAVERTKFRRNRRAPRYFDYDPPPLRVSQHGRQVNVGKFFTRPQADLTLFDFGGCSVIYEIDISGPIGHMIELSDVLYSNEYLCNDARERVMQLMDELKECIVRPNLSDSIEEFAVFHMEEFDAEVHPPTLVNEHAREFARLLRSETGDLGEEEVRDAVSTKTSYGSGDLVVVDWNGALFFGEDIDDVKAVLEFCNLEFLEMRFLDEQLDTYLESAYQTLTVKKKGGADLNRVARLQVDSAILFEAVENALKLLGDQYLARVYSLASQKFHLPEWHSSIRRKLDALDSIYQKLADRAAQRRSEVLEWIIILLILVEVVMGVLERV